MTKRSMREPTVFCDFYTDAISDSTVKLLLSLRRFFFLFVFTILFSTETGLGSNAPGSAFGVNPPCSAQNPAAYRRYRSWPLQVSRHSFMGITATVMGFTHTNRWVLCIASFNLVFKMQRSHCRQVLNRIPLPVLTFVCLLLHTASGSSKL